jgi:hypothetical protein
MYVHATRSALAIPALAIPTLALLLATAAAGCSTAAAPAGSPPPQPAHSASTAATAVPLPSQSETTAANGTIVAGPPVAALAAEGGDPTDGQLGTYAWGDGGSDSPWLRGARIAVGSGEPITVTVRPPTTVTSWSARSVPSTADGPAGATVLGEGTGQPRFTAPGPGTWTVEVHVVFADGLGNASYFWQLAVD